MEIFFYLPGYPAWHVLCAKVSKHLKELLCVQLIQSWGDAMAVQDDWLDGFSTLRVSVKSFHHNALAAKSSCHLSGSRNTRRHTDLGTEFSMVGAQVATMERRKARRYLQRLPLILSVFNRGGLLPAHMINCSHDGVCAEALQRILPGTSLHLRIDASSAVKAERVYCDCFRTNAVGEVKWCRPIGQGHAGSYHFGIRYYPYY
jgi:hypothetical protein